MTNNTDDFDELDLELMGDDVADPVQQDAPRPKKKSSLMNIVIIGAGVVLALAFFYFKFGNPPPAATDVVPVAEAPAVPENPQVAAVEAPVQEGQMVAPTPPPEEQAADELSVPPVSDAVPEDQSVFDAPEAVEKDIAAQTPPPAEMPTPVQDSAPAPLETQADVPPSPAPINAPPAPVTEIQKLEEPVAVTPAEDMVQTMTKLNEAIVRLDSKISALESKVEEINQAPVQSADLSGLEEKISTLSKKMEKIEKRGSEKPKETPSKVLDPIIRKPVSKSAAENGMALKAPAQKVEWILRAAQPGQAWLSKRGESQLQSVKVGDLIPGVGTVTAISQQAGRWVVSGTDGQVSQ